MGRIRKLTLEEWFLDYQLDAIWNGYCHLGFHLDIDVTKLVRAAADRGVHFSPTAVMIRAIGLMATEKPAANRVMLRSLMGPRMLELDTIGVNLPVMVANNGDPFLSGMVIKNPHKRGVPEIQAEIGAYAQGDLLDKPIGRFIKTRKNTWYNRLALRMLHFMAYRVPSLYLKYEAGGFSASSVIRGDAQHLLNRGQAYGHTASTFCLIGMNKTQDGREMMMVGGGLNHSVMSGGEFQELCNVLSRILSQGDLEDFYPELANET
ncbi:MAG: hypothetical protein HOI23_21265 [Deltaproteobacteria bacterium]|jgi:hypothetical protein|nr:hypothetical protein [Deltaproteobacteria bacterium]MBT6434885.1 hypothetical protein [Deltaproteobacteria bacterium]MBT6491194.1 hypothetical protein [Deltaproteobacteria bacterium]